MQSKTLVVSISKSNIKDQVAALLYATGKVLDSESVEIHDFMVCPDKDFVPVTITITKRTEVRLIEIDGI